MKMKILTLMLLSSGLMYSNANAESTIATQDQKAEAGVYLLSMDENVRSIFQNFNSEYSKFRTNTGIPAADAGKKFKVMSFSNSKSDQYDAGGIIRKDGSVKDVATGNTNLKDQTILIYKLNKVDEVPEIFRDVEFAFAFEHDKLVDNDPTVPLNLKIATDAKCYIDSKSFDNIATYTGQAVSKDTGKINLASSLIGDDQDLEVFTTCYKATITIGGKIEKISSDKIATKYLSSLPGTDGFSVTITPFVE